MILRPLQKLPNNVVDLGKIIVAASFEWLPKAQKIVKSGHTATRESRGVTFNLRQVDDRDLSTKQKS